MENTENYELIKRTEIPNSPFTIIETEKGCFGALGEYKVTKDYETKEEIEQDLGDVSWNNITKLILVLIEKVKQIEKQNNLN